MSELTLKERIDAAWRVFMASKYIAPIMSHGERLKHARLVGAGLEADGFGHKSTAEIEAQLKRTDPVYAGRE